MVGKNNQVVALGCRLNIFEAQLIAEQTKKANISNTIVVNTCTVTQEAHKQSMQTVRRLKRENPNCKIIVTGCGAQIDPSSYNNMPEVSKVIGNKDKFSIEALLSSENVVLNDINKDAKEEYILPQIQGFEHKTRAFIQIQQGCNHKCTFCIIYQARGKSRSVSKDAIISQIQQAVSFGHLDVVLTGVDLSSWERDTLNKTPSMIGALCQDILKEVPNLQRLRLSSLDPAVEDENILHLLKNEERFMPHLHLSLQAMNNAVLRNMGRRHTKESARSWIEKIKEANPQTVLGADIICGFPRETEEQFLETCETIQNLQIPLLHVFPYSEREGTLAAKMKPISMEARRKRATILSTIGSQTKERFYASKVNAIEEVLVEAKNTGYTKDYSFVKIQGAEITKGTMVKVHIQNSTKNFLIGELLN